jgi:hypothetical protein
MARHIDSEFVLGVYKMGRVAAHFSSGTFPGSAGNMLQGLCGTCELYNVQK